MPPGRFPRRLCHPRLPLCPELRRLPGHRSPAGTAEAAATPAPIADTVQPPQGLVETGAAVLDYDEIRLIDYFREYQPYPDTDYYTMCRDGKWGLMRSDGTEVLPCRASEPLFECSWNAHHWHGYLDGLFGSPDYEAAYKAASQTLTESGDGRLCAEHDGGGYRQFVFLQDDKTYLYSGSMGPGQFITLTDDILRLFSGSTNGPCARAERHHHARKRLNGTTSSATGCTCIAAGTAVQPTILYTPRLTASLTRRWPPPSARTNGCIWTQRAMK